MLKQKKKQTTGGSVSSIHVMQLHHMNDVEKIIVILLILDVALDQTASGFSALVAL